MEFKDYAETESAMKKMLTSLEIANKVSALVAKDPIRFIYSPLVRLIASVDPQMQLYLCSILCRLRCLDDPTNTIREIVEHFKLRETTCSLLAKDKDDLELTPEELLTILDASKAFSRNDLIEMLDKPP